MSTKPGVLVPRQGEGFVETTYIKELTQRALNYIRAGFPLHLSGPTGVGKTTLAFHIASQLGRPVVLICGDYEFGTSDLVGGLYGYHKKYVVDNFIRSVLKTDESMTQDWIDNRLTHACEHGLTLIYDEFTRSRPEANNVLLSVLEERILTMPAVRGGKGYIRVHPDFTAIFTSNPEEYAGVQKSQDALRDRMVTIELGNLDAETETAITQTKSGLSVEDSQWVVCLVRKARETKSNKLTPTVRACIRIGRIMKLQRESALDGDGFRQICRDILLPEIPRKHKCKISQVIDDAILAI